VNYSGAAVAVSRSWRVPDAPFLGAPDTVRCTPDSPVNYSEAPLDFPEGDEFELESSGAPDTVRWCTGHCPVYTGQSGAPDQRCLRLSLCSFVEPNTWSFYWLSVNLLHLYNSVAERKQIIRYGSGDAQATELFRLASSSGAVELRVG
jgi:hypothetical protein